MVKVKVGKETRETARPCARKAAQGRGDQRDWGVNGAQGRNRTTDTAIFSRMLYQLSYLGPDRRSASLTATAL